MADQPQTPATPPPIDLEGLARAAEATDTYAASTDNASDAVGKLSDAQAALNKKTEQIKDAYTSASSGMVSFIKNLNSGTALTDGQSIALSKLTSQLSVTANAFSKLENQEVSTKFVDQYAKVSNLILKEITPVMGKGADAINSVTQRLLGIKLPTDILKGPIEGINAYITKQFAAADASNRLRDTILSNAVNTGKYGDILRSSGDKLQLLTNLVENHNEVMINAQGITGMTTEQIQSYYNELNKIPGAFDNVVQAGNGFNISMLAATATLSSATRLSSSEITKLMRKAYDEYGVSDERALKFVARMSESSNSLKLPFENVKNYMEGVAKETGMLGENIDSASRILNEYSSSFTKLGLSAGQATHLISGMTSQVTSMNIAQKAFLSSQSGGPGGLMGAFQIDKLIKDHKLDEVMKMVETQLKKQFGTIVTLDEASQSQQSAAQFAKQMTILKSGPLGQFAKTDSEAQKILEALKNKDTTAFKQSIEETKPSEKPVEKFLEIGNSLQEKSLTLFSRMAGGIDALVQRGAVSSSVGTEMTYSASRSSSKFGNKPDLNAGMREDLKSNQLGNVQNSEQLMTTLREGFKSTFKSNQEVESGKQYYSLKRDIIGLGKQIGTSNINAAEMIFGGDDPAKKEKQALDNVYNNTSKAKPISTKDMIDDLIKDRLKPRALAPEELPKVGLSREIDSTISRSERDKEADVKLAPLDLNLSVTGMCINCKEKMNDGSVTAQVAGTNPASRAGSKGK